MYRHDDFDQRVIDQRVAQFRDQTRRFLAGELTEDEFRPLRLQNGLYLQRHAPMLRIAIPYGVLSARQLRKLADIARRYDRGYGHFSTRQNLQLNWPQLADVPEILAELATVQMHAIQTSGNCVRNVTTDHFAGIAPDEAADPRVYCEILRQWFAVHPEFSHLPRKFKIAVSGGASDRAAVAVHDVGLQALPDAGGGVAFRVLAGGGLGRTPLIGAVIREALPEQHLITYLEAILRVYNRHGRRDNKYKARIKILVKELTPAAFRDEVEREWRALAEGPGTLAPEDVAAFARRFAEPRYEPLPADAPKVELLRRNIPAFDRWHARNVAPHRQPGYCAVTLSLKRTGVPPGDASAEDMEAIAHLAERYSLGEIRVTHEQNLVLPHVRRRELFTIWQALKVLGLATPNVGLLTNIIACPGGDFCSLANARSIPVAEAIQRRFDDLDYLFDVGELDLNISGCMNSCGHHHVGHIGILGVDKQGEEFYQITIGGAQTGPAALGRVIGPSVGAEAVPDAVERLVRAYLGLREDPEERFVDTVRRLGVEPFRDAVYADHQRHSGERQLATV
jgi:sulfite reductase (NADPH) hemoprotein beta-component